MNHFNSDALGANFAGAIILPDDPAYETERQTYIVKEASPLAIVQATSTDEVAQTIKAIREMNVPFAVRSGKHSVAGFSTVNDGVVLDLSPINTVEILDKDKGHVRIGSGAQWGEVAIKLNEYGLGLTSGDTTSVGVGGLTLGGGIGWMVRKYGFTIDSLIGAEVVLADGSVVYASRAEHSDLFWALRGGGGNFGVVTFFDFEAHPVDKVVVSTLMYEPDDLATLLTGWCDHMRTADENLTSFVTLMPGFGEMPASVMVMSCYADDDEAAAERQLAPLRKLGTLKHDDTTLKPYPDVLEEAHPPAGVKAIVKNMFIKTLSDEIIAVLAETCCQPGSPIIQLRFMTGAVNRVKPAATAIAHRANEAFLFAGFMLPLDTTEAQETESLKKWEKLAPYSSGAYANFLSTNTEEDLQAIYPPATYERLAKIKRTYDPGNLFTRTYNIKPAE